MLKLAAGLFAGALLFSIPADAACGRSFYRELNSRAATIDAQSGQCKRAQRRNRSNYDRICAACGPLASNLLSLERFLRRNRGCLVTAQDRRVLRLLRSARDELRFVKRGCGY
jgi:hypothetical protein